MRVRVIFMTIALLTACLPVSSPLSTPGEVQPVPGIPEGEDPEMASTISIHYDPGLQSLVEMAKEDLAQKLSVSFDKVILIEAKSVLWPDASLGCPQPGMRYKQVPEDGALIILQVEGINYRYHNGGSRGLFLCETYYKDSAPAPKIDIFDLTPTRSEPDSAAPDHAIPPGDDQ